MLNWSHSSSLTRSLQMTILTTNNWCSQLTWCITNYKVIRRFGIRTFRSWIILICSAIGMKVKSISSWTLNSRWKQEYMALISIQSGHSSSQLSRISQLSSLELRRNFSSKCTTMHARGASDGRSPTPWWFQWPISRTICQSTHSTMSSQKRSTPPNHQSEAIQPPTRPIRKSTSLVCTPNST